MTEMSLLPGLDAISASLGAATPMATIPRPQSKDIVEVKESPEIEDDYQEARSNLKELIGQAMEYMPEVMEIAKQSQSDKMISAAATFLKTAADLNISMSKLSKEIKRPPQQKGSPGQPQEQPQIQNNVQNNIVFNGSTEEFLDMLEARKKEKKDAAARVIDGECVEIET